MQGDRDHSAPLLDFPAMSISAPLTWALVGYILDNMPSAPLDYMDGIDIQRGMAHGRQTAESLTLFTKLAQSST